jgi:hypothetical protein
VGRVWGTNLGLIRRKLPRVSGSGVGWRVVTGMGGAGERTSLRTFLLNMFARFGEASCDVNIKKARKCCEKERGSVEKMIVRRKTNICGEKVINAGEKEKNHGVRLVRNERKDIMEEMIPSIDIDGTEAFNMKKACNRLCGKGRVRTQDLGYQAERYDHCATRPLY